MGISYEVSVVPQTTQVQLFFSDPAGNGVELNFDERLTTPPSVVTG
jgi:catechol-2,3-dioxygenase